MGRRLVFFTLLFLLCTRGYAQSIAGDVLAGKLVKPKAGVWAWYDLTESATGKNFLVRLAIVGEEKVGMKTGYWLELEVVPLVGYKSVYKMLVTGPASDPANIHKMLQREGTGQVEDLPLDKGKKDKGAPKGEKEPQEPAAKEPERTPAGEEDITTPGGAVHAQHFEVGEGAAKQEVWLNEDVRPMGIVKLKSAEGELVLRNYGVGGKDARSVINEPLPPGSPEAGSDVKVEVHVEKGGATDKAKGKQPETKPPQTPKGATP